MNLEERYFRLLGWVKEVDEALNLEVYRERYNGEVLSHPYLPNILDSQAEFIKRVVVPMRERGYNPQIIYCGPDNDHFVWKVQPFGHQVIVKIKDNNIFEAAILGACEVLEGGKETG